MSALSVCLVPNVHCKGSQQLRTICTCVTDLSAVFASKGYPFKNLFDFTTAGDWDCVVAVERLPALHYSVDFIFLSLVSWVSLWNFKTIRGSLMKPKWQKLASLAQEISTL